jgi:hypothetical protein
MDPSIGSAPTSSKGSIMFKIWKLINTTVLCRSSVYSEFVMGVVNTSEAYNVLEIKVIS